VQLIKDTDGRVTSIVMRKPFDMHHHVRDGEMLKVIAPMLARRFAGGIIMPNTSPPIVTAKQVGDYRKRLLDETGEDFTPLMTMYLTDTLDCDEVMEASKLHDMFGVKYYPRGLTTNSDSGVADPASLWTPGTRPYEVLQTLSRIRRTLLLHAADGFDRTGKELNPYEQEPHFIRETLPRIKDAHPHLKISVEHLSTIEGADYMQSNGDAFLGCSLTSQHLLLDTRDLHRGGFNAHRSWFPIIQGEEHKERLLALAKKGLPFVWLGTDSAPHPVSDKEAACCKGGVMMVHAGIELYAEAFDKAGALANLEDFASKNGPNFYGVQQSNDTITLRRQSWTVLENFSLPVADGADPRSGVVRPFRLGEQVEWQLAA